MALTKAQHDKIRRDYEERQHKNHRLLLERREQIYALLPEYRRLEEQMGQLSISRTHALIDGDHAAAENHPFGSVSVPDRRRM